MKFTQETDYAFRIVQTIAKADPGAFLTAADMSDEDHIPFRFLLRVLRKLKHANIVVSRQGMDGGYRLARPASEVSLLDVVEAIEGKIHINRCLQDTSLCNGGFAPHCPVHNTLMAVQARLVADLESQTFANLEAARPAARRDAAP